MKNLAHTKCNCNYHVVSSSKYRRREIYGNLKVEIGKILRERCKWEGVEIIEANACIDHIHMLLSIQAKISVSSFIGLLKGKSSLMLFEINSNLNFKSDE